MTETALITGCSKGGIGDALAQEFYHKGVRVIGLEILQLDVTSEESIQDAAKYIQKETGGKLNYLVNNAGIGRFRSC
jgi:1-acylglycerone phosphate reductase